jgi:hypothetical protein
MTRSTQRATHASICMILAITLLLAGPAWARSTEHLLSIQAALGSDMAKQKLLDVPVFFAGQKHPAVARKLDAVRTNKKTRGAFRSDEKACQIAFLSAVIQLQQRALRDGGNAVIDITSIARNQPLSSATEYRCVAGSVVVHVGLQGNPARIKGR